jgi:hypothetical protein
VAKRRSNDSVTAVAPSRSSTGVTGSPPSKHVAPPIAAPTSSAFPYVVTGTAFLAVIGLIAIVWSKAVNDPTTKSDLKRSVDSQSTWQPKTDEDRICDRFMLRRRAGDPAAAALLGREPVQPAGEVTEDEAQQMQTDFFLHDPDLQILTIRRGPQAKHGVEYYVLVTHGNVSAPRLSIRLPNGESSSQQRTMTNPDLFVEVRDGKIYGVFSRLHHDR